jgi:glycerol-3-phosphate dehydrogenase, anaerobic, C subunit
MKNAIPQPDRCIACTTCTVVCPVAQATPEFLGPRMIGPAHERFRLAGLEEDRSLHYCANCKNCDISCPCGVPVSTFIMRARATASREYAPSLRDWILAHSETLARWMRFVPASLKNFGMQLPLTRSALDMFGVAKQAPLPDFVAQTFHRLFSKYRQPAGLTRTMAFFPGCYVTYYDPASGMDMVTVFNRAGYRVMLPKNFACCGLPLVANGFWEDARKNAEQNMRELASWKERGIPVITGCPSCSLMFKEDYAEYFPDLKPDGLAPALTDACEFLLDCIDRKELVLPAFGREQRILYHAPCHLRAQGMGFPGLDLLNTIPGVTADNVNAGCCGISGSYGFKKDKYAIAMQVGSTLFEAIRNSEAPVCASECGTCRVQMRHGGGKDVMHPISFLREHLATGR